MSVLKKYKNAESVAQDLKILDLERKIAFEEIQHLKEDYLENLKPVNWMHSGITRVGKVVGIYLIKKMLREKRTKKS